MAEVAMAAARGTQVREELRAASDETIEDAVLHAELRALRGLLYQLTGDEEVASARLRGDEAATALARGEDDSALLRRKAAEFLQAYRDRGAGEISFGPEERLAT